MKKVRTMFSLFLWAAMLCCILIFAGSKEFVFADVSDGVILTVSGEGKIMEGMEGTENGEAMGKVAAKMDAYRNMAKEIYGSKVLKEGNVTEESVSGFVTGAKVTKEECQGNACKVELTLYFSSLFSAYAKTFNDNQSLYQEIESLQKEIDALKKKNAELNKKLKGSSKKKSK